MTHACDLCGSSERTEIEPGIGVCIGCGFVYVPERRSPQEIAADWSNVYASGAYDPNWPGVKARLYYVAEWLDQTLRGRLGGKTVLDIGAGGGLFLEFCRDRGAHPVGLDPDGDNVARVRARDIACFQGAIEDHENLGQYDLVTMLWTLENCGDCLAMLRWARKHLAPGGRVVVATGSRILVPPRKSYAAYMGTQARDLHCFRWSRNSLTRAFFDADMMSEMENDFMQNDVMIMSAVHGGVKESDLDGDDPDNVIDFFRDWKRQWP